LLRNPVERVISLYHHYLRYPNSPTSDKIKTGTISLLDFARSNVIPDASNAQVGMIANGASKENPHEYLKHAMNQLDQSFAIAGIMESFDETLLLMKKRFGWNDCLYKRWNVNVQSRNRASFSRSMLKKIEKANALDIELYHYARKRLSREIRTRIGFQNDLRDFKRINRNYCRNDYEDIDQRSIDLLKKKTGKTIGEMYEMAEFYYDSGHLIQSLKWFEKIVNDRKSPPQFLFGACFKMGAINRKLGKRSWRHYFRKALQLFSTSRKKTELEIYRIGSVYRKLGDDRRATRWFVSLLRKKVWNTQLVSGACFHLGEIAREAGEIRKSKRLFLRCLKLNPGHRKAAEYLDRWTEDTAMERTHK